MVSGINHSLSSFQYPPLQQDDAGPQRTKRSIDPTATQQNAFEPEGMAADDRRKNKGGGLDSLGRGNVL
ncbi:hypothetical protein [Pseudomonas orientalis]|uniref:Uncharacterized protein n=1 Tax=Pseudomonas orientalis TaxID=76758 RepID=A0A4Q7D635_9PSED|nr:hypothetical protein [Pseudomonas orientalis]POM13260.1 hypothetical protein CUU62_16355 [Pseudomonas sp. WP001]RZI33357.1 hypothetical protein EUX57_02875 [Pseudomonas orientalis]